MLTLIATPPRIPVEYISFPERKIRAEYIARRFSPLLRGRILDVGCDNAHLRKILKGNPATATTDYFGIDLQGEPDLRLNLEEVDQLPFEDGSFDVTICTDVLEHLDNFHRIFHELMRVTRKSAIISLPNCWAAARLPIARGRGGFQHHGLPLERPVDRHKWFFSLTQAMDFFEGHQHRGLFRGLSLHATEKPRAAAARAFARLRYPEELNYLNRYAHTLWAVIEF